MFTVNRTYWAKRMLFWRSVVKHVKGRGRWCWKQRWENISNTLLNMLACQTISKVTSCFVSKLKWKVMQRRLLTLSEVKIEITNEICIKIDGGGMSDDGDNLNRRTWFIELAVCELYRFSLWFLKLRIFRFQNVSWKLGNCNQFDLIVSRDFSLTDRHRRTWSIEIAVHKLCNFTIGNCGRGLLDSHDDFRRRLTKSCRVQLQRSV